MSQYRRANSSRQDLTVYPRLKDEGHTVNGHNVPISDREERWFKIEVKEAVYVKVEKPYLKRGGGLRHHLSPIYNAVLSSLPWRWNKHSHLSLTWLQKTTVSSDLNNSKDCCYNSQEPLWTEMYRPSSPTPSCFLRCSDFNENQLPFDIDQLKLWLLTCGKQRSPPPISSVVVQLQSYTNAEVQMLTPA